MALELVAHASTSSFGYGPMDVEAVVAYLSSPTVPDRIFAMKQISIWLIQKSHHAQEFIDQGHVEMVVECLRASDDDSPSSSTAPDVTFPCTALLHDFAKEGKKCQNLLAALGAVPLLVEYLPTGELTMGDNELTAEAVSALCLMAVGSEESRKEILAAGGLPSLIRCLSPKNSLRIRREAAGALIGLSTEHKERQAAIIEAGGFEPLIQLLEIESDADNIDAQLGALNAAAALRRLCDTAAATIEFCKCGGLEAVVSRIVDDEEADRLPLRLPMPLAPSTIRAECKQLLGDVYVGSTPMYQEKIVAVLETHDITIDRITTTPTASEQTLEGKDSMEKGHKVLSCRTSIPSAKVPEIKLHLKRAMRPKPAKVALEATKTLPPIPRAPFPPLPLPQGKRAKRGSIFRRLFACTCMAPSMVVG